MRLSERVLGLDVVRATAILLVICGHFLAYYFGITGRWSYPLGVLGVEIFFVLSGYLIGGILLDAIAKNNNRLTPLGLMNFWWRRWLRTIPNYLLFLFVFVRMFHYYEPRLILRYLTFTQNLVQPMPQFYSLSWSLAVEEWFYLLFPILILIISLTRMRMRYCFIAAMLFLFIMPLILRLAWGPGLKWESGVRKMVVMRLDALMWGVLMAAVKRFAPLVFTRLQSIFYGVAGLIVVAATMIGLALRYQPGVSDFLATRQDMFWFIGFDAGMALALPMCVALRRLPFLLTRFFVNTSQWSYSMYLCHLPLMLQMHAHIPLPAFVLVPITALSIFGLSALLFHFFEKPVMKLRELWKMPEANTKSVEVSALK